MPIWQETIRFFPRVVRASIVRREISVTVERLGPSAGPGAVKESGGQMTSKSKAAGAEQHAGALLSAEERSRTYLRGLAHRRVFPSDSALAALSYFHEPFPEMPS